MWDIIKKINDFKEVLYLSQNLSTYQSDIDRKQGFVLTKQFLPAGKSYPLHWHDFIEFELILSGTADHIYNHTEYTVSPGSAYMMCYYDFHGITALTDLTLYSIHFDKELLPDDIIPFLDFNRFRCQLTEEEQRHILQLLDRLTKEADDALPFHNLLIHNILSEIVIMMIRKSTTNGNLSTPLPIQQAISYINANFTRSLTLEEMAGELSFSPNYLGQLFKKQTGRTFNEYLNTLRLKYACSLLSVSNLSVKEVAFTAGYRSVEYFLYQFKKNMLMTPNEYRRQSLISTSDTPHP